MIRIDQLHTVLVLYIHLSTGSKVIGKAVKIIYICLRFMCRQPIIVVMVVVEVYQMMQMELFIITTMENA